RDGPATKVFDSEGVPECSRRLSVATPPETRRQMRSTPAEVAEGFAMSIDYNADAIGALTSAEVCLTDSLRRHASPLPACSPQGFATPQVFPSARVRSVGRWG